VKLRNMAIKRELPLPLLCLVTDRMLCDSGSLEEKVAASVSGGVDMVQLREKDIPAGELLELASKLRTITKNKALLIINDRLDVALAAEADGLHLPEDSLNTQTAREIVPQHFLVGKSVHSLASASTSSAEGADYLILGTIFPSSSKPGAETGGLDIISEVSKVVDAPVLAIGGVNPSNVASVIESGARGVAVISSILSASNPEKAARYLKQAIMEAWEARQETALPR